MGADVSIEQTIEGPSLERYRLIQSYLQGTTALSAVAGKAGISLRTAQRWVEKYRKQGVGALGRKERTDRGQKRTMSLKMAELTEGLALERPRVPVTAIYRELEQFAGKSGERLPSYPAVRRAVKTIPISLMTLAHSGSRAYSERFDLIYRREASRPNAIWQADHAQLRINLLREDGSLGRPWLTIVIDDYSRAIAGYYLGFEPPSTLRTSLALRQAMWRKSDARWQVCGIPDMLYTDNGSDFTSRHMEYVAADLKMQLVFSTPGHPRGRGRVERFFRSVNEMFLCTLDGYVGKVRRKPSLSLEAFDALFKSFLLHTYHSNPRAEEELSPVQRWEKGGFLPRMPDSLKRLDLLLVHEAKDRKVRPDGVHFLRLRYLSPVLAAYVGESVTVRYDPRDLGEIRVFFKDKFLCRAISAELAGATVPLREIVRSRKQRKSELQGILKSRQRAVDSLLDLKRGHVSKEADVNFTVPVQPAAPKLKRYRNE